MIDVESGKLVSYYLYYVISTMVQPKDRKDITVTVEISKKSKLLWSVSPSSSLIRMYMMRACIAARSSHLFNLRF